MSVERQQDLEKGTNPLTIVMDLSIRAADGDKEAQAALEIYRNMMEARLQNLQLEIDILDSKIKIATISVIAKAIARLG